jgi:addiction module RelE/StbE family toxin
VEIVDGVGENGNCEKMVFKSRKVEIEPDWILIYAIEDQELVLYRTGSHADLFR